MIRSRRDGRAPSFVNRVVLGVAVAALLQGCVAGLPRLIPGSNVTLPKPPSEVFVDHVLGGRCDATAGSPRARDAVECKRTPNAGNEGDPRPVEAPRQP